MLFTNAIEVYPLDVSLRIAFAVFLMRVMKNKHQAMNEITQAESLKQSLDERFILFYIK